MENKYSFIIILVLSFFLSNCQINPATGEKELSLISTKEEDDIGETEHKKIIKQFGIYENRKLQSYVNSLGEFLVSTSELSNKTFTFTILDSPIVNAFALPGGYIYLTRGLLALCDNEAQLAGVISHEIGHITARHAARRYTKSVGTNLILNVLGTLTNNQVTKNLMGQGAGLFLLSYSRSQEYEADKLALRYMNRAGFEPFQMANFLQLMENYSKIKSKILKIKNTGSELLRTHPNSSKRVNEVIVEANNVSQINPIIGRDIYLKKIDGLLFGHNQDEGFFLKDRFVHPKLQITFPLINDFYFVNTPKKIIGINDNKSKIIYDIDESSNVELKTYVVSWAKKLRVKLGELEARTVNNFEFLTGEAKISSDQIILVVARDSEANFVHRFILISKKSDYKIIKTKFIELTRGLRKIDDNEFSPPRIKVITANSDENFIKKTINSMNIQKKEAKLVFEILNKNLDFDNSSGKKIKIVY